MATVAKIEQCAEQTDDAAVRGRILYQAMVGAEETGRAYQGANNTDGLKEALRKCLLALCLANKISASANNVDESTDETGMAREWHAPAKQAKKKARVTGLSMVAGTGFEPVTFGL